MLKLEFSPEEVEAVALLAVPPSAPARATEDGSSLLAEPEAGEQTNPALVRYLQSQLLSLPARVSSGGVEKLQELNFHRPQSQLVEHKPRLEGYFRVHPPATCAEAAAKIEELTGVKRGPTQTRKFLKKLGMKPRKVGQIPAKADVKEQEGSKKSTLSHD
jgi:transposase